MDILNNYLIKNVMDTRSVFDLNHTNKKYDVIVSLVEDPLNELKKLFDDILHETNRDYGFYELCHIFHSAQTCDNTVVIHLIINVTKQKITSIQQTFAENSNNLNMATYIQIWQSYKIFSDKIYAVVKNYQKYLVDRNIKIGNISHDILSVLQISLFYNDVISNNNYLSTIANESFTVTNKNVDKLINYIDSIRAFLLIREFTNVDRENLTAIIKNIINKIVVLDVMCCYINKLILDLTNNQISVKHNDYSTICMHDIQHSTLKKIYKVTTILSIYAHGPKILACYTKYMQLRILDFKKTNLQLEIEIVKRLSGIFGKNNAQRLMNQISDIYNTIYVNDLINNADIQVTSAEYMELHERDVEKITPIICTKANWKIYNNCELRPIYPTQLKYYHNITSKIIECDNKHKYKLNWQACLGYAKFNANLASKPVNIICNTLQAIALCYLNDNIQSTISQFSNSCELNENISRKIFESLYESNLIIYLDIDTNTYIVNIDNYSGDSNIDIRKTFIETFEIPNTSVELCEHANGALRNDKSKKSTFNKFVSNTISRLKTENSGLKTSEYRKMAVQEWHQQKKTRTTTTN